MADEHIEARATIAAALIQSGAVDPRPLASSDREISASHLEHLHDLTERICAQIATEAPGPKTIIAAALIQSRAIDTGPLASSNKDISAHKLVHLRDLTERIYNVLAVRTQGS